MPPIHVRPATPADSPAIHSIYRIDADGSPWSIASVCAEAVARRLAAGYLTLVAEDADGVIGHADYVVGDSPGRSARPSLFRSCRCIRISAGAGPAGR